MPAAAFMLCPADTYRQDAGLLTALFPRARDIGAPPAGTWVMDRENQYE